MYERLYDEGKYLMQHAMFHDALIVFAACRHVLQQCGVSDVGEYRNLQTYALQCQTQCMLARCGYQPADRSHAESIGLLRDAFPSMPTRTLKRYAASLQRVGLETRAALSSMNHADVAELLQTKCKWSVGHARVFASKYASHTAQHKDSCKQLAEFVLRVVQMFWAEKK